MYDIDLFDAQPGQLNAGVIGRLHTKGVKVVCYLDSGAWESYRPDAAQFPKSVIGNSTGLVVDGDTGKSRHELDHSRNWASIETSTNGTNTTMSGIVDCVAEVDEKSAVAEWTEFVVQSRDGHGGEVGSGSGTMCRVRFAMVRGEARCVEAARGSDEPRRSSGDRLTQASRSQSLTTSGL